MGDQKNIDKYKIKKGSLSKEELTKRQRNGGLRSVIVRRQKKTFQELAKIMLEMQAPKVIANKIVELFPEMNAKEIDGKVAVLYAQYVKAIKGDIHAACFVRDTAGEKPVEKKEITGKDGQPIEAINITVDKEDLKAQGESIVDIMNQVRKNINE